MRLGTFFTCQLGSCYLLSQLDFACKFIVKSDTAILAMPCVLAVMAVCIGLLHPIGTTCQLGLSWSVNGVRSTFILSALQCFWLSSTVIVLSNLVIASTNQSGLNISFNFQFSSKALFNSNLTVAISVACVSILL